jgi:YD repeat-containing protein
LYGHRRDTTCDYPDNTKPKFKSDYQRDGLLRVTKLEHKYLGSQSASGYDNLGTCDYTYDSSANALSANQSAAMGNYLDADRTYGYDTLNRLLTGRVADTQDWTSASFKTSWYNYDDLGNRISHAYRDTTAIDYQHDKANRMTTLTDKTQGYDLAGNLTLANLPPANEVQAPLR